MKKARAQAERAEAERARAQAERARTRARAERPRARAEAERASRTSTKPQPTECFDPNGGPRWGAIALFCQHNHERLRQREREFVDDMVVMTKSEKQCDWLPSQKQCDWLMAIFERLRRLKQ
jgi:hypothetical protein